MYFEITPHEESDYDCAVMPAKSEQDYDAAYKYAVDRLDQEFDNLIGKLKIGILNQEIRVVIKLCDGAPPEIE